MTQHSQVLSLTHTSADLVSSVADKMENQVPNIPNQTETIHETVVPVREQFRRTEAERARMATAAAQGATPRGMGGGSTRVTGITAHNPSAVLREV
jgi:alanyl-tRNA synthetase